MLNNMVISGIRTIIPMGVGAIVAYGAHKFNIVLGSDTQANVNDIAVFGASSLYYVGARAAEKKWKWAGWLLGHPAKPTYTKA